jgi:hypothetical protein
MMFDRGSVPCLACSIPVEISRSVFGLDFKCPHCGEALQVSPLYGRILVAFSVLVGYALAWEIGSYGPRACFGIPWGFYLLWMPIGFLVLSLLIRIAPFGVKPALVLRPPFAVCLTSLNLSSGPKNNPKN